MPYRPLVGGKSWGRPATPNRRPYPPIQIATGNCTPSYPATLAQGPRRNPPDGRLRQTAAPTHPYNLPTDIGKGSFGPESGRFLGLKSLMRKVPKLRVWMLHFFVGSWVWSLRPSSNSQTFHASYCSKLTFRSDAAIGISGRAPKGSV